ncbi:MAG: hypothetical protein ACTSRA_21500 [Promethearchaeota archaeon]
MEESKTFDYQSDWAEYFNEILKNLIRDDINNRNLIKTNIIESNQPFNKFLERNRHVELIPSKEDFFHNLKIKYKEKEYYFYLDTSDERFWIVHNIEKSEKVNRVIEDTLSNSYLQDKIYLSHNSMSSYLASTGGSSLGFTLKFDQLFSSTDGKGVFKERLEDFEDVNYTLQLWPKKKKSIDFFIKKFQEIKCPINYSSLNFVFEDDETRDVLVKENLHEDGSFTIDRGKDIKSHLRFVNKVRDDYHEKMDFIESNRIDWATMKGELFSIEFDKEIHPKTFVDMINKSRLEGNKNPFKISAFFMYSEGNSAMYSCIDTHTGGKFFMQVFPDRMVINLDKESCGNIIFRLYTNLQRHFSIGVKVYVDDEPLQL